MSKTESNRRSDSNNTNKSELLNEQLTSEDNQSARTIIVCKNFFIIKNFVYLYNSKKFNLFFIITCKIIKPYFFF